MYLSPNKNRKDQQKHWLNYRLYSRQIINQPMNMDIHTSRIMTAMELDKKEPLQGALADMFFGCWYDVPYFGERMLSQVKEKLSPSVLAGFEKCVVGENYVFDVSPLATRWSVLTKPSMQAFEHQLRISSDDSRTVAESVVSALLDAVEDVEEDEEQEVLVIGIENEFFAHCLATDDRLAFSIVWWELAKNKWEFHEGWTACRQAFKKQNLLTQRYHLANEPSPTTVLDESKNATTAVSH